MGIMDRPTILEINLSALKHNINEIRKIIGPDRAIFSVVKADAYGLGAHAIAPQLERLGVNGFSVATCREGVQLRESGVTLPILIMGGMYAGEGSLVSRYDLMPAVYSEENIEAVATEARRRKATFKIHLKINTGMNRLGVQPNRIEAAIGLIRKLGGLELVGVFSHLAEAHPDGSILQDNQIAIFEESLEILRRLKIEPRWIHLSASSGVISSAGKKGLYNAVRPGILMYGSLSDTELIKRLNVRPVISLVSEIVQLRRVEAGQRISYSGTYTTECESLLAVIPMGYADGLPRSLSNKGDVLVHGLRAPIRGRVCMDMTIIDVTDIPDVALGDQVIVFGSQDGASVPLEEVAAKAGTIPYEIITGVSLRVPRMYRLNGLTVNSGRNSAEEKG